MPSAAPSEPLLRPTINRPFVDRPRQAELDLIEKKVAALRQGDGAQRAGPRPRAITIFWGAFGVGKSWLLRELEDRYAAASQAENQRPIVTARIDLDLWSLTLEGRKQSSLWEQIPAAAGAGDTSYRLKRKDALGELIKRLEERTQAPADIDLEANEDEVAHAFVHYVTKLSSHFIPLLLFDSLERVANYDEEAFRWLELRVFEGLALTDRVLLIFASRNELQRWDRFQVRRRIELCRLAAFNTEDAQRQVKANEDVSRALYCYAFGHPLMTEWLARWLEKEHKLSLERAAADQIATLLDLRTQLKLLAAFEDYVMAVRASVSDDERWLARDACILRLVNVGPLRAVVQALLPASNLKTDADFVRQISRLQQLYLLYFDEKSSSWAFDRAVRRVLELKLKLEDPARFENAHHAACEYYLKRLREFPEYAVDYLPAAAYHASRLREVDCAMDWKRFQGEWRALAQERSDKLEETDWQNLLKALQGDTELQESLGNEFTRLIKAVRAAWRRSKSSSKEM